MIFMWVFVILAWFMASKAKRERKAAEVGAIASDLYSALQDKVFEMLDDPFVSDRDWQELLPICRHAEEYWLATHPYCQQAPGSLVKFVEAQLV